MSSIVFPEIRFLLAVISGLTCLDYLCLPLPHFSWSLAQSKHEKWIIGSRANQQDDPSLSLSLESRDLITIHDVFLVLTKFYDAFVTIKTLLFCSDRGEMISNLFLEKEDNTFRSNAQCWVRSDMLNIQSRSLSSQVATTTVISHHPIVLPLLLW